MMLKKLYLEEDLDMHYVSASFFLIKNNRATWTQR